ncbi:hypothetical protein KGO95_00570 [Patescibacteria group bacterium]|nr:hypothetical protein [Patescibacteria group bacterium]
MDPLSGINNEYVKTLKERVKKSRVYVPFQSTGLLLAELLHDQEHKSLYMRIAKLYDNTQLIRMAKDLAERKNVDNRGAYFMKMLSELRRNQGDPNKETKPRPGSNYRSRPPTKK